MDILLISAKDKLLDIASVACGSNCQVQRCSELVDLQEAFDFLSPSDNWFDMILYDLEISEYAPGSFLKTVSSVNQDKGVPLVYLVKEDQIDAVQEAMLRAGDGYLIEDELASTFQANFAMYQRWCERAKRLASAEYDLNKSSLIDHVTQLPNARSFDQEMVRAWCQLKREKQALSLIILDVDHFERYIQVYGQEAADETLRLIALLIDGSLSRPLDTVARLEGTVLAVLLPNTSGEGALKVAQVAMRHVREAELPFSENTENKAVTISMAVVSFSYGQLQAKNTTVLLQIAQEKLSQIKEKSQNIIESFELEKDSPAVVR